ncbi:MAG: AAA family ATPase [Prosthecochloris sp.]|nr:AAA family ATPase [Prosthecochloris sp.]
MRWPEELLLNINARIGVMQLVTPDEDDALRSIVGLADSAAWPPGMGLFAWDIADQYRELVAPSVPFQSRTATQESVLNMIDSYEGAAAFILKDYHHAWQHRSEVTRMLRNLAARLPARKQPLVIIITSPEANLPQELLQDVPVLEAGKPGPEQLRELLHRIAMPDGALQNASPGLCERLVESALGLSLSEAGRAYRKAIVRSGTRGLDERAVRQVMHEKQYIIRGSGALELYPYTGSMNHVGGADTLKSWLDERKEAFSDEARQYGLSAPKGVALIGIPGTGKSLCAKVTAGHWGMTLLRMDVGAVFSGLLGSSEQNVRQAIRIAEVIAPCVLWVDEIEKAFAGQNGDSGTANRVMATFLTWMQEKTAPVFVFATANNIDRLPPELLRKGRFDEIFFLDLPTAAEREGILDVHLRKHGYSMIAQRFDLPGIARVTEGFVGSELEAVVNDAMFPAFRDNRRELETADLLRAAKSMVPLARSHREHISRLRHLVEQGLARNASSQPRRVELDRLAEHDTARKQGNDQYDPDKS